MTRSTKPADRCSPAIDTARLLVMSTAWLSSGFFHDIWTTAASTTGQKTIVLPRTPAGSRRRSSRPNAGARPAGLRSRISLHVRQFRRLGVHMGQIDGAFSTEGPTPPLKPAFGEEDPVIGRESAFPNDPFQPRQFAATFRSEG